MKVQVSSKDRKGRYKDAYRENCRRKIFTIVYHISNGAMLDKIDNMLRSKENISNILAFTNKIILKENFGLSQSDIRIANDIWIK